MGTKGNKKIKENKDKNIEEKSYKVSDEVTENIIITLVLILFLVIVSVVVIYVIRVNNPSSFKSDEELYEEALANLIEGYNMDKNKESEKEEDIIIDDGSFSVLADNIFVEGKLPKTMKSKYYIECYTNGLVNIYSKYTYALSQTKYGEPKGIILQIMIADDKLLKDIEEEGDKYTVITKIKDYSVIYIIPDDIQYLEEDDVSRSNYEKLSKYRDEIIESITAKEFTETDNDNKSNVI